MSTPGASPPRFQCDRPDVRASLRDWVLGRLDPVRSATVEGHVAGCESCASQLAKIVSAVDRLDADVASLSRRPRLAPAVAIAASLLLAGLLSPWLLDRGTALREVPDEFRGAVNLALASGRFARYPALARLAEPAPTLAAPPTPSSGDSAPALPSLDPAGTSVREARPTFRWPEQPGALQYEVMVAAPGESIVAESGPLAGTEWVPAEPLPRGVVLTWQVRVTTAEGERVLPPPEAPRARIAILDQGEEEALDRDLARAGGSDLARAVVLARHGAIADANRLLDRIVAEPGALRGSARIRVERLLANEGGALPGAGQGEAPTTKKPAQ